MTGSAGAQILLNSISTNRPLTTVEWLALIFTLTLTTITLIICRRMAKGDS